MAGQKQTNANSFVDFFTADLILANVMYPANPAG